MEIQTQQPSKPAWSERFVFGFGSAFFLGLFVGGFITDKIIKPDLNNPLIAEKWLGFFFILFFLIGFAFPQIFTHYFIGLLRGRGTVVDDNQLQNKVSYWWAIYFIGLLLAVSYYCLPASLI